MRIVISLLALAILGAAVIGPVMSNVEQPQYTLVSSDKNIEIRDYHAMILAQTETTGERKDAIQEGFRRIADYIFGNNQSSNKIAMTAPVIQQEHNQNWQVSFIMPSEYEMDSLPKPMAKSVMLKQIPGKRFAVIRFSGAPDETTLAKRTDELKTYLNAKNIKKMGAPIYAFYNPPWTLPFLRRNEVMLEVIKD